MSLRTLIHYAFLTGQTEPLKEFLTTKQLTRRNQRQLVDYLNHLECKPRRWAPSGDATPDVSYPASREERGTGAEIQKARPGVEQHDGRKYVPTAEASKMLGETLEQIALTFNVPRDNLSADNVLREEKAGRAK